MCVYWDTKLGYKHKTITVVYSKTFAWPQHYISGFLQMWSYEDIIRLKLFKKLLCWKGSNFNVF